MADTKLYGRRWRRERAAFLKEHPLCAMHKQHGKLIAASVVDHIRPHKGDLVLFWNQTNWQALCKQCHDSHKQRLENSGTVAGCDQSGRPIDPLHHWNRKW